MKRILFLTCMGSLVLALTALGAPNKGATKGAKKSAGSHAVVQKGGGHVKSRAPAAKVNRTSSKARSHATRTARTNPRNNAAVHRQRKMDRVNTVRADRVARDRAVTANARNRAGKNQTIDRTREINRANQAALRRDRNGRIVDNRGIDQTIDRQQREINQANQAAITRERNAQIVNNWQSAQFAGENYVAFREYRRERHDRDWWQSHYPRIILVSGGWWYWNAGYSYRLGDMIPITPTIHMTVHLRVRGSHASPNRR